jgi:hypothetical protein
MTNNKSPRHFADHDEPPNALDFSAKDPLRETYEGRWKQLPLLQKIGLVVVLGFWVALIAGVLWGETGGRHLLGGLPLAVVVLILMIFLFVLGKSIR